MVPFENPIFTCTASFANAGGEMHEYEYDDSSLALTGISSK